MLSKEALKEWRTEKDIQSMLSDSYNSLRDGRTVGPIESNTKRTTYYCVYNKHMMI